MARNYRTPTAEESAKMDKSREMMKKGIEGEKDFMSKVSTTMAKSARDDQRAAKKMMESVPAAAREGAAYNQAGYRKGGMTKKYANGGSVRGAGVAQRGVKQCKMV
jgi:phage gpG-like protein